MPGVPDVPGEPGVPAMVVVVGGSPAPLSNGGTTNCGTPFDDANTLPTKKSIRGLRLRIASNWLCKHGPVGEAESGSKHGFGVSESSCRIGAASGPKSASWNFTVLTEMSSA